MRWRCCCLAGAGGFHRAALSRNRLPVVSVVELDEPLDLRNGKPWIVLVDVVQGTPGIEAVDDRVWKNTRAPHDGPSRYFSRYLLDQFALRPVDFRDCMCARHEQCSFLSGYRTAEWDALSR